MVSQGTGCLQLQHKQTCWCTSFPHRQWYRNLMFKCKQGSNSYRKMGLAFDSQAVLVLNMNPRVERPLLHQPHLWTCQFSSLSNLCLSGVTKARGLLMAKRKQKILGSHRVSHSHICECSYGISPIARQGHRQTHTHFEIFFYIQPSLRGQQVHSWTTPGLYVFKP